MINEAKIKKRVRNARHTTKTVVGGVYTWVNLSIGLIREDGVIGILGAFRAFRSGLWRLLGLMYNYGTPIYDHDWDILIVLDACRADLMAEVVDEYEFLDFGTINSVGSASPEWMEKNFSETYSADMHQTAYVTGNPYSDSSLNPDDFLIVDQVWEYGWDDNLGTVKADVITDRAISVYRSVAPDRMIVHYMQPHHPFVPKPLDAGMDPTPSEGRFGWDGSVWQSLRDGQLTHEEVWTAYRDNLTYVLDHVAVLLDNLDAETVVITSDHGNAFGEHNFYGHPIYVPIEPLKRVPWCVTTAVDSGTYEPTVPVSAAQHDQTPRSVNQKLADLGYL